MIEDTTVNEETITNCRNQIQITNEKGTFSVSAEDFAEKFKESLYDEEYFPGHIEANLLDFLQGYGE